MREVLARPLPFPNPFGIIGPRRPGELKSLKDQSSACLSQRSWRCRAWAHGLASPSPKTCQMQGGVGWGC